jgi:hypothetical protein
MNNSTSLFGKQTKQDWQDIRSKIITNPNDSENWERAIALLEQRLQSRYFRPIAEILKMKIISGEGFAVMTLICSLLEFLQSCYEGKTYEYRSPETKFKYSKSHDKFKNFLETHEPFKPVFSKLVSQKTNNIKTFADDFYSNVRCGLLHEATTNNGWIIKSSKNTKSQMSFVDLSDENRKIIYRDTFFEAIKNFSSNYQQQIHQNKKDKNNQFLRDNFCRKLDYLCMINDRSAVWWNP